MSEDISGEKQMSSALFGTVHRVYWSGVCGPQQYVHGGAKSMTIPSPAILSLFVLVLFLGTTELKSIK